MEELEGVRIVATDESGLEVLVHCEDSGLGKPLAECNNKEIGRYGESLAARYLESMGLRILERNWRCAFGEVDLVAEDDCTVVLTEVKSRLSTGPDDSLIVPELAVNYRKRNRYQKLALTYLAMQTRVDSVRFGVVAVKITGEHDAMLRYFPNAYEWDC